MKKNNDALVTVRITGPDCWDGDRHYLPGENATIPAALAAQWVGEVRADYLPAEVTDDSR